MQKNRPEIVINDRFRSELKSRIISDIGGLSVGKERNSSNWKVVFWVFATAFGSLVLVLGIWNMILWRHISYERHGNISFSQEIHSIDRMWFRWDSLKWSQIAQIWPPSEANLLMVLPQARTTNSIESSKVQSNPTTKKFSIAFSGDFILPKTDLPLYKRDSRAFNIHDIVTEIPLSSFKGIDISQFENTSITNISFTENRPDGYIVNIDLRGGTLNLSQDLQQQHHIQCDWTGCPEGVLLTKKDIPSDQEFKKIGDTFLDRYAINRGEYSGAIIDDSWKNQFEWEYTIPETVMLTYPFLLDGKPIYEKYSSEYLGLQLFINTRTKK